ncbi:MAG TPA: thiamine pyrophosphate-binding protein [Opitutaceae bacterium]
MIASASSTETSPAAGAAQPVKLSDYVMRFLQEQGVDLMFLLTGGGAMHLNDSLGSSGIRYVCNLHEQACAIAAEGYAKFGHRLGAAMVTVGPGATNTLTGVAGAWLDSTPVIFISGQVKTADLKGRSGLRNRGPQEIDIIELVKSITKYAVCVSEPASIRYHLEKAVHLALTGRPGPVWIEIPLDVQTAKVTPDELDRFEPPSASARSLQPELLQAAVKRTLEMLRQAERPYLLLGNGIRLAGALPEMGELVERWTAPFGLTWPAMDFVPDDHPNLAGRPGGMAPRYANFTLQNCDFFLSIGARLDIICTAFAPERYARGAQKIMVDIDPAELEKMRPHVQVPVCADAKEFLRELLAQWKPFAPTQWSPWRERCTDWKRRYPLVPADAPRPASGPVSMYAFTETLGDQMSADALVIPTSSGTAIEIFLLAFKAKAGQRMLQTPGLGAMGFGLPASIGGCLANDSQTTICIDGDGGFQMNIQELETIARLKLPIKIFVINNGGYGSIVTSQNAYFKQLVGSTPASGLTFPETQKIAAAYGIPSSVIANHAGLSEGIRRALAGPGPHICEVMAVYDEPRQPRVSSSQSPSGKMVSKPLEDLFPFLPREEFLANMIIPALPESA